MLASLGDPPPPLARKGCVYEPKYDGIRALIDVRPGARGAQPHVAIYSRNGIEKTAQFPAIVDALRQIAATIKRPVLLDGEIVAIDANGKPLGFQRLQGRIHLTSASDITRAERQQPATLVLFDMLRDGDEDLRGLPLVARRLRLQERIQPRGAAAKWIRLSDIRLDDGGTLWSQAEEEDWEGLIVKAADSVYSSGRRTPAWRKLKRHKEQELVIGGWTEPRQTRQHFGALLVGYYDDDGVLRWAGSVGTGFDERELDRLAKLFRSREIDESPFADRFKTLERAHWVKPDLVAEVRFTEWTSDGLLRHPVYLGLRDDKPAREVRREDKKSPGTTPLATKRRAPAARQNPARPAKGLRAERQNPTRQRVSGPSPARPAKNSSIEGLLERLEELERTRKDGDIVLPNGDTLRVTNLAKVFWPKLGITKGELLRYYVQVSPFILPAVDDRPLVMKRFPNGIDKQAFYQQRHPEAVPPGVRREVLPDDIEPIDEEEGPRDRLIGGSLTTLLYMTQLAAISQDPWFSRVADPMHQDHTAIDLDPGEGAGFKEVLDVARYVKDELDRLSIPAVPKTSGSRGLHIYIPLPPKTTYQVGQLLAEIIATIVASAHPKVATVERWVKRRPRGTVYVDYLQNILGKTLATAYAARATEFAGVSTPLHWKEVKPGLDPRDFTIRTAPARFRKTGDLWARLRTGKPVDLGAVLEQAHRKKRR
jgi:bifunctional non-homologous end joining protein LigD